MREQPPVCAVDVILCGQDDAPAFAHGEGHGTELVSCLAANRRVLLSRDGRWPVRRAASDDRQNSHLPQALSMAAVRRLVARSRTVIRGLPRWVHRLLPPPPLRCAQRRSAAGAGPSYGLPGQSAIPSIADAAHFYYFFATSINFCAPRPCHGDLLVRLANTTRDERIAWWRAVKAVAH